MKHYSKADIENSDRLFRLNMMNSCTGYKSANLLATKSNRGITNLAVFNSVTHIGSNPALLGFILRPTTVPRNTFQNIKDTGVFTVNHITKEMIHQAHQTSAKYNPEISEFEETGLNEEFLDSFSVPYVQQSPIKLGCRYLNEYYIKENDTILIIAAIEHLYFQDGIQATDGWLKLEDANIVTINGLDGYALPALLDRFNYARPEQEIKSIL